MNIPTILPTLVFVLSLVVAWICVVILFRGVATSLFRYRLWQLRDAIVDDVLSNRIEYSPLVAEAISGVEALIQEAPTISFLHYLTSPVMSQKLIADRIEMVKKWEAMIDENSRNIIGAYRNRGLRLLRRYLTFGSISGWAFGLPLRAVAVVYSTACSLFQKLISRDGNNWSEGVSSRAATHLAHGSVAVRMCEEDRLRSFVEQTKRNRRSGVSLAGCV